MVIRYRRGQNRLRDSVQRSSRYGVSVSQLERPLPVRRDRFPLLGGYLLDNLPGFLFRKEPVGEDNSRRPFVTGSAASARPPASDRNCSRVNSIRSLPRCTCTASQSSIEIRP